MPDTELLVHRSTDQATVANVTVDTSRRADNEVNPYLFAKFCEHLGTNIYHGMEAQILFNPVFGEWHFAGRERPSGGKIQTDDPEQIREAVENHHGPLAYPESTDPDALLDAYRDALAFGWLPTDEGVSFSPDTGPSGNRAQRIETSDSDQGVEQRTHLPLHRVHDYEFRCKIRAPEPTTARVTVSSDDGEPLATTPLDVDTDWEIVEGTLSLPSDVEPDDVYRTSLTTDTPAELVVERVLLYPTDHVDHADPEVVELLRESDLPLLRWPGGNFVSGYHWQDGIGPVDERPTKPNPAWDGLEYNLFGTDEFMQFCEHVGCEPMICVNAGDGTPEEAAKWVEYCNGDPEETEMGRLRAEHGHPEPYDVTHWEIGNELWGQWQTHWTTATGYADRYERFREAMLEVDADIDIIACGLENMDVPEMVDPLASNGRWNDTLLERVGDDVRVFSDHILACGGVDPTTDPKELVRAYMGFSAQLGEEMLGLKERMRAAGIEDPHYDMTELQIFAGIGDHDGDEESVQLTRETMPTPLTISEVLYDACIRNEMIRTGGFARMLTHSASVNHGGGLRKAGERVWADPCHYGRTLMAAFAGDTPIGVEVACDTISTGQSFREIARVEDVPAVDAMAAEGEDALRIVLVNRTTHEKAIDVTVDLGEYDAGDEAELATLGADTWYAQNSREDPEAVTPEYSTSDIEDGTVAVTLEPYSFVRVTVPES
ncbi:alpha-L-arabinofuranosidase C-terminal domain-containing protein [Halosimplex amylolyticum]|uniref:alpha-L-arabinofuranosidase C-terminal domain-containing protein n=1 Tax=Halosimplex amylolyticum TaxID=3396616 RepID=UPI003F5631B8